MTEILNITAADVRRGDVWLGQSEVDIVDVAPGDTLDLHLDPFAGSSPVVPIQMVRVYGRIVTGRVAFKMAARVHHPDAPGGNADVFRQVSAARDVLTGVA